MPQRAFRLAVDWSPQQMGVNGVALNASTTSNTFPIQGMNQIQIGLKIVNATGAALPVTLYPEIQYDGETDWRQMVTQTVGVGTITFTVMQLVFPTTAAAAATYAYTVPLALEGLDGNVMRFRAITAAGAGATDLAYIRVKAGHTGA